MFFLISGAAAAGKSTLVKNLPARLANLACHDMDEKWAATEFLRCQHLEEWVQLALQRQAQGQDFLLVSQSPLGELLACPSAPKLAGIAACLLDCSDMLRVTRMRQRGFDPRWPPCQDVLNWAAWQRMHAWDPQWEQRVIIGNGPSNHAYTRWTHWTQTDARWQVHVIDTTGLAIEPMLDRVSAWITAERGKAQSLAPETKWWE
jgi:hypothetical protein